MRVVSWTVVFGAVAALVYTGFKPFWKELAWADVPVEQVSGAVTATGDTRSKRGAGRDAARARGLADARDDSGRSANDRCEPVPAGAVKDDCPQPNP